jgi:hypothetical protein
VSWNRDRDLDGIPDWQEDENYADEAPIRGPGSPRARLRSGGCALPVALLLAAAGLLAHRPARRVRRGGRRLGDGDRGGPRP